MKLTHWAIVPIVVVTAVLLAMGTIVTVLVMTYQSPQEKIIKGYNDVMPGHGMSDEQIVKEVDSICAYPKEFRDVAWSLGEADDATGQVARLRPVVEEYCEATK